MPGSICKDYESALSPQTSKKIETNGALCIIYFHAHWHDAPSPLPFPQLQSIAKAQFDVPNFYIISANSSIAEVYCTTSKLQQKIF